MEKFYKSKKLDTKSPQSILRTIKRVEADDDWDGISSAAQVKFHYPDVNVIISNLKVVTSDSTTLVLDKWTNGNGWIIDHHTTNPYKNSNALLFSTSGEVPASRLTYLVLDKSQPADLFLSATAEITDGLYITGLKNGSLHELSSKFPIYFKKSTLTNQFLKEEEIFTIADILAVIAKEDPEYSLKLGLDFYNQLPRNHKELNDMLDSNKKEIIKEYEKFINSLTINDFETVKIKGKNIRVIDRRSLGKYYMPVLEIARRKHEGNYILFKGNEVSIRTKDEELLNHIFSKLSKICISKGGRAGAYGIRLKAPMRYEEFKKLVSD